MTASSPTPLCTKNHRYADLKHLPNPHPACSSIQCKVDWNATNQSNYNAATQKEDRL